ncbi:Gfo/Idh/MocA family oxidoreductase [Streptomyces cavernae]|uniref:Gfo/Idh/MocA family protein n=1 Tax=Streptomyces cavernae TaxID=2259034 RepID=UPI000FEB5F29|nr:Gfo/Idh/MocA family oxidoreductase [Streptomyces cavernae]
MRVGIVGAGRMGRLHARTLLQLPDPPAVAVHDVDPDGAHRLARALAEETGARVTVRRTLAEVVAGVDALVVATPATQRRVPLLAAARAGVPVFCEKPLTADVAEARELAGALAHARVHVGFQRRCDPAYRALRERIVSGRLGRVLLVRCTAFDHEPPADAYERTAGDIFTDCLIHDIDAVHWLTGQPIVALQADGARLLGGAGYDVATAALTLADGARAVLTASRLDPHGYDHRVEVLGTEGSYAVGLDARTPLRLLGQDGMGCSPAPGEHPPYQHFTDRFATAYRQEIHDFVDMVTRGATSPCTAEEALRAQEVAAVAGRAAATGTRVVLDQAPAAGAAMPVGGWAG